MTQPIDTAEVEIRPDLDGFAALLKRQLDAAFAGARARIGDQGRQAGEGYGRGFGGGAGDELGGFFRDVRGRLHDERGRFVAEGRRHGESHRVGFARGFLSGLSDIFAPLGRSIPLIGAIGTMMGNQLATALKLAALAGVAQLGVELAGALAPAVGAIGLVPAIAAGAATAMVTFKLALSGVGDALKAGLEGDVAKLGEAMKNLAPSAREFVRSIVAVKKQGAALQQAVQQQFFFGLGAEIRALATTFLPLIEFSLIGLAAVINQVGVDFARMLRLPANVATLDDLIHDVAIAVGVASRSLLGFGQAFVDIGAVGATFLPGLADGLHEVSGAFARFIAQARASGQLQEFISGGLSVIGEILQTLQQVGSVLVSVFTAASQAGGGLLPILGDLLGQLATFLRTAEGAAALQSFFTGLAQAGNALGAALSTVLPALGGVLLAVGPLLGQVVSNLAPALAAAIQGLTPLLGLFDFVGPLSAAIAPLLPILGDLAGTIGSGLAGAVGALVPGVQTLVTSLATALAPVLPVIADLFATLAPIIGNLGITLAQVLGPILTVVSAVLVQLGPVIAEVAGVLGQVLVSALLSLLPLMEALAPALAQWASEFFPALLPLISQFGDLLLALLPAIGPLIDLMISLIPTFFELNSIFVVTLPLLTGLLAILTEAAGGIASFVGWVLTLVNSFHEWAESVGGLSGLLSSAWEGIKAAFSAGVEFVGGLLDSIIGFVTALPGRVGAALTALPGQLVSAAQAAFDAFFFAIGFATGTVIGFFQALPGRIVAALSALGGALSSAWTAASTAVTNAVSAGINAVIGFFTALPGRVSAAVSAIPGMLSSLWNSAFNAARTAVTNGVNAVVNLLSSLPGRAASALSGIAGAVRGALSGAASWLYDAGRDLIMGLIDGVKNAVGAAIDAVKRAMSQVVAGAKKALGIGSPSRVFAAIGDDTVAGYVRGINRGVDEARAAVAGMTLGPIGLAGARLSGAGAGDSSPAGATVTALFDEERVVRALVRALNGLEFRMVDVDRVVSRSLGRRADLARRGG